MKTIAALTFFLVAGVSLLSAEVLTDVGYPPPGGVTFSGSGDDGTTGATFSYSNFNVDPALYSALYWGPTEVDNVINSNDPYSGQMTYAGTSGSSYVFTSTALWEGAYNTRMLLTPTGLGAEDTEANLGASTTPSYPLFLVTGNFTADFVIQAFVGGNWEGVDTAYNSQLGNDPNVQDVTNVNFDFFTAPAAASTPEPGSLFLFGAGAVLAGLYRRRARR